MYRESTRNVRELYSSDDDLETTYSTSTYSSSARTGSVSSNAIGIVTIAVPIVSFILATIIFFAFVIRKKDPKSKFAKWCKEFLNFRKIWLAGILKYAYLFSVFATTLGGFVYMFVGDGDTLVNILIGLCIIIFGNIGLRLGLELTMLLVGLWENSADIRGELVSIRKKLVGERLEENPIVSEEPKPEKPAEPVKEASVETPVESPSNPTPEAAA